MGLSPSAALHRQRAMPGGVLGAVILIGWEVLTAVFTKMEPRDKVNSKKNHPTSIEEFSLGVLFPHTAIQAMQS
jgi:hypothetical protein